MNVCSLQYQLHYFGLGQSNTISSSHKVIKKDTTNSRKPIIKFMHITGKALVEEWSNARNPTLNIEGNLFENPNYKVYVEKPVIGLLIGQTHSSGTLLKQHSFVKTFSTKDILYERCFEVYYETALPRYDAFYGFMEYKIKNYKKYSVN